MELKNCYGFDGCCKACDMQKRDAHRTSEPDLDRPGLNKCLCHEWICAQCIHKKSNGKGCSYRK